jgi:hypothetical protein
LSSDFSKKIAQILIPKFVQFYLLTFCGDRATIGYIRGQESNPPPQKIFSKIFKKGVDKKI